MFRQDRRGQGIDSDGALVLPDSVYVHGAYLEDLGSLHAGEGRMNEHPIDPFIELGRATGAVLRMTSTGSVQRDNGVLCVVDPNEGYNVVRIGSRRKGTGNSTRIIAGNPFVRPRTLYEIGEEPGVVAMNSGEAGESVLLDPVVAVGTSRREGYGSANVRDRELSLVL